ncbi:MAG: YdcF family protein [Elusimicrobia bacterium]|nr:YdcF family protein [Elusimicrobiota bacterium]
MFLLKKIIVPFLLPPGFFVTLALGLGLWNIKKSRIKCSYGYFFAAVFMWLALARPAGDMALARLEYAFLPPADVKADVIVVLGGGINEGAPGGAVGPSLEGASLERAAEAARLYKRYRLPIIVSGGAAFSGPAESPIVKKYLVSAGVPADKIITEERSRDTFENAVFSKKLCDEKGYKKAVIVTSAYHMKRAVWSFEKAGFKDAVPYPTGYKSSKTPQYYYVDFLPGPGDNLRAAMHEYLGLVFYKISRL